MTRVLHLSQRVSILLLLLLAGIAVSQALQPVNYYLEVGQKRMPVPSAFVADGAKRTLPKENAPKPKSQGELKKEDVRRIARKHGLFTETDTNPQLAFTEGDISFFYEQKMSESRLELEFAARAIVLQAADKEGVVIGTPGDLSHAAHQIMSELIKERARQRSKSQ